MDAMEQPDRSSEVRWVSHGTVGGTHVTLLSCTSIEATYGTARDTATGSSSSYACEERKCEGRELSGMGWDVMPFLFFFISSVVHIDANGAQRTVNNASIWDHQRNHSSN